MKQFLVVPTCAIALAAFFPAHATLVLENSAPFDLTGTGLGAENTILTTQAGGNATSESGCVAWNGTMSVAGPSGCAAPGFTGADTKTGASQAAAFSLASLGISAAAQLQIVFNPSQPARVGSVTLDNLVLTLFDSSGNLVFTSGPTASKTLSLLSPGTGRSGYFFGLDSAQATAFDNAVSKFGGAYIGLQANVSNAAGGLETFFVSTTKPTPPPSGVPEPATFALMGAGLLFAGVARHFSRRRA